MRIHFVSNSIYINSGFGKVTRYLALGLKKLGHDISITGLQTSQRIDYDYGIPCYPIDSGGHVDEATQLLLNLQNIKPDVLIYVGQLDVDLNHLTKIFDKQIIYCPVEGHDIPDVMANDLKNIIQRGGNVLAQCRYGQEEMIKVGVKAGTIYHGYDPSIFYKMERFEPFCYYATSVGKINTDPVKLCEMGCYRCTKNNNRYNKNNDTDKKDDIDCPYKKEEIVSILIWDKENKRWSQKDIGISKLKDEFRGKFLYLGIMQNFGVRKRIERLIKAYSILINDSRQLRDKTHLHLHTLPISIQGINLIKIIRDLGINDNISFSYGTFRSSGWSEEGINCLYNIADINVSASSSEGFCIVPDSPILTLDRGVQKIKDIKVGDKVLTHKGRFMRVSKTMKREYNGDMVKIISHKLRIPIILTPEHRILGIKTELCRSNTKSHNLDGKRICTPGSECYYIKDGRKYKWCRYLSGEEPWRRYKTEWIEAGNLEKGDFAVYPIANEKDVDIEEIKIRDYIDDFLNVTGGEYNDNTRQSDLFGSFIEDTICMDASYARKHAKIPAKIKLDGDLMRLFGYFIAEGDIAGERQIEFTFNINEIEYIEDVERIMKEKFGLETEHIDDKTINDEKINVHILRYSNKVLSNMFQNMFCPKEYVVKKGKGSKANIVRIPPEFLNLPLNKLGELIKGTWRGDGGKGTIGTHGYIFGITSETLSHQLVYLLTKFNILASLRIDDSRTKQNKNWSRVYKIDILGKNIDIFDGIIGERHKYRNVDKEHSRYIKGKNLYYLPIEKIDILKYHGDVWNIEVEEDNSYVNSIVLHNCLPVLEGFATGLPMIAPNCSSFIELIGEDPKTRRGLLSSIIDWQMIPDGSIRALVNEVDLANQMKIIYQSEELRKTLSKNAIKFAQDYTWEKIVMQWDQLLKTI